MLDKIDSQPPRIQSGEKTWVGDGQRTNKAEGSDRPSFDQVLQTQLGYGLKFSAHAQRRLAERSIKLDGQALERLDKAVERANEKGSRESLVLLQDMAFVVSVKNRTVITALDGDQAKDNVFTNVDSVVIAK